MKLTSPAFADKQPVPAQYTCKGSYCSPPFEFLDIPANTQSLVLLVEDLDEASQYVHWLLYNIPASTTHIPEGKIPEGALEGLTSQASTQYHAPCPKDFGGIHRFSFTLYALDKFLEVPTDADRPVILQAMDGNIIRQA